MCIACVGKAVVDTVMDWLEVEEIQINGQLCDGWVIHVGQRCVHQVPISDHHPILVEVTSEGITCVTDEATDVEGSSSVEVVAS